MAAFGGVKTPCMLVVLDLNPFFWGARSYEETERRQAEQAKLRNTTQASSSEGLAGGSKPGEGSETTESIPTPPILPREAFSGSQLHLSEFLAVMITFLNAYRMMNKETQIRIIACHLSGAALILDTTNLTGYFAKALTKSIKRLAKSITIDRK